MGKDRWDVLDHIRKYRGWLVAAIGTIFLLLAVVANTSAASLVLAHKPVPFYQGPVVVALLAALGSTLLTLGFVNIFLESRGTSEYFEDRLDSVIEQRREFFRDLLFSAVSRDVQELDLLNDLKANDEVRFEELRDNLLRAALGKDFAEHKSEDGGFLKVMREQIEPLLVLPHFDDIMIDYDCQVVQRPDGVCYMRVERIMESTMHVLNDCKQVDFGFMSRIRKIEGVSDSELYSLESFTVQDEDYAAQGIPPMKTDGERLKVEVSVLRDVTKGETLEIHRKECLLVPLNDIFTWSVRPGRSARAITVTCKFDSEVYPRITAHGFSQNENGQEPPPGPTKCILRFKGWMVPYQGFVISWSDPCLQCARRQPVKVSDKPDEVTGI